MEQTNETFQRFGKSFQEDLCHLMLQDRPFCDQITEVLNLDFLQYEYLRVFAKTIVVNIKCTHLTRLWQHTFPQVLMSIQMPFKNK